MKRLFCLLICILTLLSVMIVPASAVEYETTTDYIYFKVPTEPTVAWKNFKMIFCHIWSEGAEGGDFYAWQAKKERCIDLGNGYWAYDISELKFEEDKSYALIFSNNNGMQTYNLTFTSACRGDIVECNGDTCENPVDSEKRCTVARWVNKGNEVHPSVQINSSGNLVDPDSVGQDVDTKWGDYEGVSTIIEVDESMLPTEAPTTESEAQGGFDYDAVEITTGAQDDCANNSDKNNDWLTYVLIGCGAVLVIGGGIVAAVIINKKKKAE